ncbi:MAG TPA: ATP synthase F1 subunit epsilon [Candidatus Saccharimonadales bacterium]|nr:ATP synthase F1 subunit epsilon [Candidatus Saccharimonadales bacterium]
MRLQLVTLDGVKFDKDVYQVILPTATGAIAVFDNHEPLVTVAVPGVITIVDKAGDSAQVYEHFASEGGIVEIKSHELRILVDEALHSSEIIEEESRKALELAQKLKDEAKDRISLAHAQTLVDRETLRLKVAELRRHRRIK